MFGNTPPTSLAPSAAPSPIGGPPPSPWKKRIIGAGAAVAVCGFFWLTSTPPKPQQEATKPSAPDVPGQVGGSFEPYRPRASPASLPMPSTPAAAPTNVQPYSGDVGRAPSMRGYRPSPVLAFGDTAGGVPGNPGGAPAAGRSLSGEAEGDDSLSTRLRSEDQPTAVATRLPDRNLFLTEGTPLPCIPDSPITSDVEGAFRCKVPEPVYSTSGSVLLIDKGTWIVGRVNSGLRRGQRRLFVVMTRIETPQGCLVRIRAPAADALGQAGLDGEIDSHFFQRFGAYIGMAFLDAAMQGAVLAASNATGRQGGVSFYQFQNAGRQGGRDLFAADAAIPPTLYRNQAEPIVVRLTQDIDMRPCFRLRTRESAR